MNVHPRRTVLAAVGALTLTTPLLAQETTAPDPGTGAGGVGPGGRGGVGIEADQPGPAADTSEATNGEEGLLESIQEANPPDSQPGDDVEGGAGVGVGIPQPDSLTEDPMTGLEEASEGPGAGHGPEVGGTASEIEIGEGADDSNVEIEGGDQDKWRY